MIGIEGFGDVFFGLFVRARVVEQRAQFAHRN